MRCEILFLIEAADSYIDYDCAMLMGLLDKISGRAIKAGKAKAKQAHEDFIAKALVGSAGIGHKLAKIDTALPPLRFSFKEEKKRAPHVISDPIEVAMLHTQP